MNLEKRIQAFVELGMAIQGFLLNKNISSANTKRLEWAISKAKNANRWFVDESINSAMHAIAHELITDNFSKWLTPYSIKEIKPKTVLVIMAGNIPMVGFHDFLCVLLSGNKFVGKLSSQDEFLLPAIADILISFESEFAESICFSKEKVSHYDAVIATGSNNTSTYFDFYFGKHPHIFRRNRNAVAVLDGTETELELDALSNDIFQYFGLGCRNVSKLFVPKNYNFEQLMTAFKKYAHFSQHTKYFNNYEYYKAINLINLVEHLDNGFVMLKKDESILSHVAEIHYENYSDKNELTKKIISKKDELQCVVGHALSNFPTVDFGQAQKPKLWDYADGVDTIEFLINL